MVKYVDPRGGLEVEKRESTNKTMLTNKKKTVNKIAKEEQKKALNAVQIVDTMESYQLAAISSTPTENGGATCLICGNKTAFDNRHICFDCWKKYKTDMFNAIKNAVEDVDIDIE